MTLEWVGVIPGKREGRRYEGLYMLTQHDIVGQTHFLDAVAYGGWAIDLHPSDGVYSTAPNCNQYPISLLYKKREFDIRSNYNLLVNKNIATKVLNL